MFSTQTYFSRRATLQQSLTSGIILLLGNEESPMNYSDNCFRFRQDDNFLYYFGLDMPHLAGIIDIDENNTILFGNELTIDDVVWMGPQPALAERAARVGVFNVQAFEHLATFLQTYKAKNRPIHFLPPYRGDNSIRLFQWLGIPFEKQKAEASELLIKAIIKQRAYKSEEEVASIEEAVNTTGAMHIAAMQAAKPGMTEAALAGLMEGIAISRGGALSYPAILTINGQTLHNHFHGNTLQSGQLVLADVGAETAMHYAGDITRTFPVDKTFNSRQKDIYNLVLDTELKAIAAVAPGVSYLDIHLMAAHNIAAGLKNLGLMQGDTEEAVREGAHALFFPHGLGHMLGLGVHDMEDLGENYVGYSNTIQRSTQFGLKSLRLARNLESGFVLTVEPGIYFIPQLIDLWKQEGKFKAFINYEQLEAWKNFGGIRVEDNVLVTATAQRVLGEPIPKTISEIEALRA